MGKNVYQQPFYVPPQVSTPYPSPLPSGYIKLFKDNNWNSTSLTIDTNNAQYPSGNLFSFSGTPLQDNATWIAFNLPENVVCTLCNNIVQHSNPYDFSHAGICVDLIGNGQTQTIDLPAYGANDCLSGGVWREVDPTGGWFQLFADADQTGSFATIFFLEWPTSTPNSIASWWLQDKATAVNFPCLTPPQLLTLSDNSDGSGQSVTVGASNTFGTWTNTAVADLRNSGMNDKVSAFSYKLIPPQSSVVNTTTVQVTSPIVPGQTITEYIKGKNASSEVISITDTVAEEKSVAVTNTATQEYQTTSTITASIEATEGIPDVDSLKATLTASFAVQTTTSSSQSTTNTNSLSLAQAITFNVPARSTYEARATISIGQLPPTTIRQDGLFYYKQNLPGSVRQSDGTYLLTMPLTIVINGQIGSSVDLDVTSTPIT